MKKIAIIIPVCFLLSLTATNNSVAQIEPDFTLYREVAFFYNPSLGNPVKTSFLLTSAFSLSNEGIYQKQPQVYTSFSKRFKKLKGTLSFSYLYDPYSYFSQNWIAAGYTHSFRISKHQALLLGARLSLVATYLEPDKVVALAANPEFSGEKILEISPDLDLGAGYTFFNGTIGAGIKHLFSPTVNAAGMTFVTNQTAFYILGAYDIQISSVVLSPSMFVKKEINWTYHGTIAVAYKKYFTLGATLVYPSMRIKGFIGTKAVKGLSIFIAYDAGITDQIHNGEIFLGYGK